MLQERSACLHTGGTVPFPSRYLSEGRDQALHMVSGVALVAKKHGVLAICASAHQAGGRVCNLCLQGIHGAVDVREKARGAVLHVLLRDAGVGALQLQDAVVVDGGNTKNARTGPGIQACPVAGDECRQNR